jgi:hypothetical protein
MAKGNLVKIVVPSKGSAELRYVQIDGRGKENYNQDGYEYVATVILTGAESEDIRKQMDELIGELGKAEMLKSKGYKQLYEDAEGKQYIPSKKKKESEGKPLDLYAFGFKTGVAYADGKPKVIKVYDTTPKVVSLGGKKIGNGSRGAVSGAMERTVYKNEVSCSLYLNSIQLTKFIPYEDDAGFEAQEGDFNGVVDDESGFVGQEQTSDAPKEKSEAAKPRL